MQTLAEQLRAARIEADLRKWERFRFFEPYPTQMEFIAASADHYELMLSGGNGVGKTELGAFIMACHLTGEYPEWWPGRRWQQPIEAWACGSAGGQMIDTVQLKLFGRMGELYGSGMIPKRSLVGNPVMSRHATGLISSAQVRHKSGGLSRITQMAYSQDVLDWQGPRNDLNWYDEEPPLKHHSEGQARLTGRNGLSYLTFTPMAGPTDVVRRFTDDDSADRARFELSVDEVAHIPQDEKSRLLRSYKSYERDARYHGKIMLGEGAIFTTPEDDLLIDLPLSEVPVEWAKGWGLDFGGAGPVAHPFGAVLMAHDRDADAYYVLAAVRMREAMPLQHCDAMRRIAPGVPVFWPHDGHIVGDTGEEKSGLYRGHGLRMFQTHATNPDGSKATWAGIHVMDELMHARQFKVRRELREWREEYRMYHLKDGKIVKIGDDLMSATRIAMMMRRYWRMGGLNEAVADRAARLNTREAIVTRGVDFDVFDPWAAGGWQT